ncbi:MAG: transcriptional regulator NrdR [Clostridiales Family XIII bacterium]|nr:transcriptional regulator NrdR [Clostridiales Family XIII bacterium]
MKCPYCDSVNTSVTDSRPTDGDTAIRRRRTCDVCGKRFTTYERVEHTPLIVKKKDGSRQSFDRDKVMTGILHACEKRRVPLDEIEKIVSDIENALSNTNDKEISSTMIGEYVLENLKHLDDVAFIRFASVYRSFQDVDSFMQEIEKLIK